VHGHCRPRLYRGEDSTLPSSCWKYPSGEREGAAMSPLGSCPWKWCRSVAPRRTGSPGQTAMAGRLTTGLSLRCRASPATCSVAWSPPVQIPQATSGFHGRWRWLAVGSLGRRTHSMRCTRWRRHLGRLLCPGWPIFGQDPRRKPYSNDGDNDERTSHVIDTQVAV
jgi:hypothetical protein